MNQQHTLPLWMLTALAVACLCACGGNEDSQNDSPTPPECSQDNPCPAGQECQEDRCVDEPDNNDVPDADDMPDADPPEDVDDTPDADEPEDVDDTPDADPPEDVDDMPDADEPEDVDEMPDVDDTPDADDVQEFDTPLDPRPETLTGGVTLFESTIQAIPFFLAIRRGNVAAAFVEPSPEDPPGEMIGNCTVGTFSTEEAPPEFGYDAGEITLSDGQVTATLSPLTGMDDGISYESSVAEDNDLLFVPDSQVTITAAGGRHIRPFSATIDTPAEHQVTSPVADATVGAGALPVTWSGANSGATVILTVTPHNDAYAFINGPSLTCTIEGDPGQFTIPAEAIARLNAPRLGISVIKLINTEVTAGDDTFIINATFAGGNMVSFDP